MPYKPLLLFCLYVMCQNLRMVSDILNSLWQHCIRDARHISRGVQVHYFLCVNFLKQTKFVQQVFWCMKYHSAVNEYQVTELGEKAKMQCADVTCNLQHTQKQWWSPYQLTFAHTSDDRNQPLIDSYFLTTKKPEMRPAIYIDDNNEPFISFHLLTPMMTDVRPASALSSGHINEARTEPLISSQLLTKMQKNEALISSHLLPSMKPKMRPVSAHTKDAKKWSPHQLSPVHTNEAQNETLLASLIHSCRQNPSMTTGVPENN